MWYYLVWDHYTQRWLVRSIRGTTLMTLADEDLPRFMRRQQDLGYVGVVSTSDYEVSVVPATTGKARFG